MFSFLVISVPFSDLFEDHSLCQYDGKRYQVMLNVSNESSLMWVYSTVNANENSVSKTKTRARV